MITMNRIAVSPVVGGHAGLIHATNREPRDRHGREVFRTYLQASENTQTFCLAGRTWPFCPVTSNDMVAAGLRRTLLPTAV
jgi:hypothetical protein